MGHTAAMRAACAHSCNPDGGSGREMCAAYQPIPRKMKITHTLAVLAALGFMAAPMHAKLAWNKKAKAFDAGVTACTSCHVDEKPNKKDHGKPLTPRGQWMVDQKAAKQAKEISLAWLKDYPGNGKDESPTK